MNVSVEEQLLGLTHSSVLIILECILRKTFQGKTIFSGRCKYVAMLERSQRNQTMLSS